MRRDGAGLALEARATVGTGGQPRLKHLERDAPSELRVPGQVHDPRPALADLLLDAVVVDRPPG